MTKLQVLFSGPVSATIIFCSVVFLWLSSDGFLTSCVLQQHFCLGILRGGAGSQGVQGSREGIRPQQEHSLLFHGPEEWRGERWHWVLSPDSIHQFPLNLLNNILNLLKRKLRLVLRCHMLHCFFNPVSSWFSRILRPRYRIFSLALLTERHWIGPMLPGGVPACRINVAEILLDQELLIIPPYGMAEPRHRAQPRLPADNNLYQ